MQLVKNHFPHLICVASILLLAALSVPAIALAAEEAEAEAEEFRLTFIANAIAMGTSNPPVIPSGTNATLEINITRWTTEQERKQLLGQLMEGQQQMVRGLQNQEETGWIRATSIRRSGGLSSTPSRGATPGRTVGPSERLRYAWEIPKEDGGRRIIAALDRPISFDETVNWRRWRDFDVTLLVLDLDESGEGEGQLAIGVQMDLDEEGNLTIENFGTEPVRLTRVRTR